VLPDNVADAWKTEPVEELPSHERMVAAAEAVCLADIVEQGGPVHEPHVDPESFLAKGACNRDGNHPHRAAVADDVAGHPPFRHETGDPLPVRYRFH